MFALLTLLVLGGPAMGAPVVNAEQVSEVPGGAIASAPSLGVAIAVPVGMTGNVEDESLIISRPGDPVMAGVTTDALTIDQAVAAAREGFVVGTVTYVLDGGLEVSGDRMSARLRGQALFGGGRVGRVHVRRTPGGSAVIILVQGGEADGAKVDALYAKLVPSLSLKAPAAAAAPVVSASGQDWTSWVTGKRLAQFSRGSATADMYSMYLCPGGRATSYYSANNFTEVNGRSVSGGTVTDDNAGSWSLNGDVLTIRWNTGKTLHYVISRNAEGHFLLNGNRWYRQATDCG